MVAVKFIFRLIVKTFAFILRLIIFFITFLLASIMSLSSTLLAPIYSILLIEMVIFIFMHMWEGLALSALLLFLIFLCYCAAGSFIVGLNWLGEFLRLEDF